jgi:hypothetical protein
MKALSIKQPWAWAFLHGKDVENREWRYLPKYKGPILIHASKTFDREGYVWLSEHCNLLDIPEMSFPDEQDFFLKMNGFGTGGVVAMGYMTGAVRRSESPWFFGPVGLLINQVRKIDFIPWRGQLGLFDIDSPELHKIDFKSFH